MRGEKEVPRRGSPTQNLVTATSLSTLALLSPLDLLFVLAALSIVSFALLIDEPGQLGFEVENLKYMSLLPVSLFHYIMEYLITGYKILFLPTIAVLALVAYSLMWHRTVKLYKPTRLPANQDVYSRLANQIRRKMDLKSAPLVLWTNSDRAAVPWVFWQIQRPWRARHVLVIPRSFASKFNQYPEERAAVLYHEMAHIRNGDTWKTIVVRCLSIAFLVVTSLYVVLETLAAIPEWYYMGSTMMLLLRRFVPLLLSSAILGYLNLMILREREIQADLTAACEIGSPVDLRRALVRSARMPVRSAQLLAFAGFRKIASLLSKLTSFHPTAMLRNQCLYDPRQASAPHIELILIAGFISVLTTEAVLRSMGVYWARQGPTPFFSTTTAFSIGLSALALFLIPLYMRHISQAGSLSTWAIATFTMSLGFVWAIGAVLAAFSLIPGTEPLYSKFQSPWSLALVYAAYVPWEIIFALLFGRLVLQTTLECPRLLPRSSPVVSLVLMPLLIGSVPPMMWNAASLLWFDVMSALGWRAYELQLVIGTMLIYGGGVLIILGIFRRRYDILGLGSRLAARESLKVHRRRAPQQSYQSQFAPLGKEPVLLSRHETLHGLFAKGWPVFLLLPIWILAFREAVRLNGTDLWRQSQLIEQSRTPPSQGAPEGYARYSDSALRASVVYPKGWLPYKPAIEYPYAVEFLNPEEYQRLLLFSFPAIAPTSPEEIVALHSHMLSDSRQDADDLIQQSVPISIPTTIGYAHGYSQTVMLSENRVSQNVILALDWLSEGIDYSLSIDCYPEDRDQCSKIFAQFVRNFEFVSPALDLSTPVEDTKLFSEPRNQYAFRYPIEWKLFDISTSGGSHLPSGTIIGLPEDQPERWTQVTLEPDAVDDSLSTIIIKFSRFQEQVDLEKRMNTLALHKSLNPSFSEFRAGEHNAFTIGGANAIQADFEVTYAEGSSFQGSIVLVTKGVDLWDIIALCELDETSDCSRALSTILNTFQFGLMNVEGNQE